MSCHRKSLCRGCVLIAIALGSSAPTADATFPGNNGLIAFTRSEDVRLPPAERKTLWTVDPRTGHVRQLTRVPSRCRAGELAQGLIKRPPEFWVDSRPAYSPSGRRIAFFHTDDCSRGKRTGIYVMRSDGTHRKLLTPSRLCCGHPSPAWSPDGRSIAFINSSNGISIASAMPGRGFGQLLGHPFRQVAGKEAVGGGLSWGPSQEIAFGHTVFSRHHLPPFLHLSVVRPDGRGHRHVQSRQGSADLLGGPDWSPDATQIAFNLRGPTYCAETRVRVVGSTDDCPGPDASWTVTPIYVVRREGRGSRKVVSRSLRQARFANDQKASPTWSPDGRRLAFVWAHDKHVDLATVKGPDIYVMPADGGQARLLVKDVSRFSSPASLHADGLSWQPIPRSTASPRASASATGAERKAARRGKAATPAGARATDRPGTADGMPAMLIAALIGLGLVTLAGGVLALWRYNPAFARAARRIARRLSRRASGG